MDDRFYKLLDSSTKLIAIIIGGSDLFKLVGELVFHFTYSKKEHNVSEFIDDLIEIKHNPLTINIKYSKWKLQ